MRDVTSSNLRYNGHVGTVAPDLRSGITIVPEEHGQNVLERYEVRSLRGQRRHKGLLRREGWWFCKMHMEGWWFCKIMGGWWFCTSQTSHRCIGGAHLKPTTYFPGLTFGTRTTSSTVSSW